MGGFFTDLIDITMMQIQMLIEYWPVWMSMIVMFLGIMLFIGRE